MRYLLLLAVSSTAACQFPELPDLPGFAVGGNVEGLWSGAELTLSLATSSGISDDIVVAAEGTFAFPTTAEDGDVIDVAVVEQPRRHSCAVINGTSRPVAAAIADIVVRCTSDVPVAVALDGPADLAFDSQVTRHPIAVSLVQTSLAVVVDAPAGAIVTVAGIETPLAVRSAEVPIAYGQSDVPVAIAVDGLTRTYVLAVERGTSSPAEYRYVKPPEIEQGDTLGEAVAADRDHLVIGAVGDDGGGNNFSLSGAVYVLRRTGDAWMFESTLRGNQVTNNRTLGAAVAIDGDIIVAGAQGAASLPGAAYIFRRQTGWFQDARLVNPVTPTSDRFGFDVAVDGTTVAISDPTAGAIYTFEHEGTSWLHVGTITAPDTVPGDRFGHRVALQGDLLAVAAPGEDSGATGVSATPAGDSASPDSGAVYLFRRAGMTWNLHAFVKATSPQANGGFGQDIALLPDRLVVGAQGREDVHVFRRSGDAWTFGGVLRPQGVTVGWGTSVDTKGDLIVVGEWTANRAQVFRLAADTWISAEEITGSNSDVGDGFGYAMALVANGLLISAHQEDSAGLPNDNSAPDAGAGYVFK